MKEWPELNNAGDLPPALHCGTLADVLEHFGTAGGQRQAVARRLVRVHSLAHSTGMVARFIIFGSFITSPRPGTWTSFW